jgi:heme/copper-type cytochrome/quinol oxidase subunit 3
MLRPDFTQDVTHLPTNAFGHRSLTWWGVVGFMVIEGAAFLLAFAAYFFLMSQEASWPPEPLAPPRVLLPTLFLLLVFLSEIPNVILKRAAEQLKSERVQALLIVMSVAGGVLLVLRGFEFALLNVSWTTNAYGSIVWALLLLHTLHVLTDWVDTLVLTALMLTKHGEEPRRFVDVSENALYWHFVVAAWVPVYLLIYWAPRLV